MAQGSDSGSLYEIVFYDDPDTPDAFVSNLIETVFALPRPDAEAMAWRVRRAGKWPMGPYPELVAGAFLEELRGRVEAAGHRLSIDKAEALISKLING